MRTLTGQEESESTSYNKKVDGESTSYNVSNNQSEMRLPLKGLRNDEFTTEDSYITEIEHTTPIVSRSLAVIAERDVTDKDHTVGEKDVISEKDE